jgi:hypothetical protein
MAEPKRIKDAARAIDAGDLIRRSRRQAVFRTFGHVLVWGALVALVFWMYSCLNAILNYSEQTEVPTEAPGAIPAETPSPRNP